MHLKPSFGVCKTPMELRPIEIHLKEDGDLDDKPSLCIVMTDMQPFSQTFFYGQISLKMFNEGLKDIGYKIVKDEE